MARVGDVRGALGKVGFCPGGYVVRPALDGSPGYPNIILGKGAVCLQGFVSRGPPGVQITELLKSVNTETFVMEER